MPKVNQAGIDLIKSKEGCQLTAYPDPASPLGKEVRKPVNARRQDWQALSGSPWTIGYGATGLDPFNLDSSGKPKPIGPGTTWTQAQAETRLKEHVEDFSKRVTALISPSVLQVMNDNQFSALVSFAYNVGTENLRISNLLKLVNARRFEAAADEFLKWNKARNQETKKLEEVRGLTIRRQDERRLFLTR